MSLAIVDLPEPDPQQLQEPHHCKEKNETSSTAFTTEMFELSIFFFNKLF